jgi:hypothetical protein
MGEGSLQNASSQFMVKIRAGPATQVASAVATGSVVVSRRMAPAIVHDRPFARCALGQRGTSGHWGGARRPERQASLK